MVDDSASTNILRVLPLLPRLGLSAEARGLMAAYVRAGDFTRLGREDLGKFAAGLCQTAPVTKRAIEELVSRGLLDEAPSVSSRGRPTVGHIGSARLRKLVAGEADYPLGKLVEHVLRPSNRLASTHAAERIEVAQLSLVERKRQYRKQLRQKAAGATRWLLAVLLAHADRWGVVQGLGSSKLVDLTGLSQERLKAQLFKLNELGFISHKVPGFSGLPLLGRWGTVYVLNLFHPALCQEHAMGLVILPTVTDAVKGARTEAGRLIASVWSSSGQSFEWDRGKGEDLFIEPEDDRLAHLFWPPRPLATQANVMCAVQHLLDQLASDLLSAHWQTLLEGALFTDLVLWRQLVERFKGKGAERADLMRECGAWLHLVAFALARRIQCMLLQSFGGLPLATCEYKLLPTPSHEPPWFDGGARVVMIRPKSGAGIGAAYQPPRIAFDQLDPLDWRRNVLLSRFRPLTRYGRAVRGAVKVDYEGQE